MNLTVSGHETQKMESAVNAPLNGGDFGKLAVVVKTVLGSHFGVGEFTTHFRLYLSGD